MNRKVGTMRRLVILVLILLILPAIVLMNPGRSLGGPEIPSFGGAPEPGTGDFEMSAYAIRVIGPDTLELYASGTRFGVGIIGIEAPQPNTDCGVAGTNFLSELITGQILFEEDPEIHFGRDSLRMYHVSSSYGPSFAHELVRLGYAQANGEGAYADELADLQAEAESNERGCLWGDELPDERQRSPDPGTDDVFGPGATGISRMTVPAGFGEQVVVSGLTYPASFAFLPNGDILIGENSGLVRLYSDGQLQSTPFIDIRSQVNDYWDRGLLSVAVDPDYESNGYVYLYFTYENNPSDYIGPKTGRLIRVTSGGTTASPSTQLTLLGSVVGASCNDFPVTADCVPSDAPSHSAGDIRFASDGSMFVTVGDGANFHSVSANALRAQDPESLGGKILRIDPGTGQAMPDNPFWDGNPLSNRSRIWASGMRNPYRFDLQPSTDTPFIGDVGWSTAEEINVAPAGVNMGWPCYEGNAQQNGYSSFAVCQDLYAQGPSAVQPPLIEWLHSGAGAAVTSGVFYTASNYPAEFSDTYFYADYVQSWIRYVQVNDEQEIVDGPFDFATGADGPVDFELGPDGNLYYLAINTGEIRRIVYSGDGSDPPPLPDDEIIYLSDIDWVEATNGWGPVERDTSNGEDEAGDGQTMSIQGVTYEKGLGVHAVSDITFQIEGECHSFLSDIGVDDEVGSNGTVTFEVWVDGDLSFQSDVLTGTDAAQQIDVDITGASELRLVVGDGGDNVWWDHANWADARLLCGEDDEVPPPPPPPPPGDEVVYLSDIDWVEASNGWGPVERDTSNGEEEAGDGQTMSILGVTYEKGLGVHAHSEITYELAAPCHTFATDIGVDDEVGSNGSVTFEIWLDDELAFQSGILTGSDAAQHVEVETAGASELRLVVGDGGDNVWWDHANWADARLLCGDVEEPPAPPPTVTITSPSPDQLFEVGEHIDFSGEAFDGQGDPIPVEALSWRVIIHHCSPSDCHMHQFIQPSGVAGGSFTVPDHGDTFYFEFRLTATDDNGVTTTETLAIHPDVVDLTIETVPSGLQVSMGGVSGPSPLTRTVVANSENMISTTQIQGEYEFESWSNGGPLQQYVTAGSEVSTYTATFSLIDEPPPATAPEIIETDPADGATDVAPVAGISAVFSVEMSSDTVSTETVLMTNNTLATSVDIAVIYNAANDSVTVVPEENLLADTSYTVTIVGGETGVQSAAGIPMGTDFSWTFATGAESTEPPIEDEIVYLSDIDWVDAINGWGPVERDSSNGEDEPGDGQTMSIQGVTYEKGLGVHALSDITFALTGSCHSFLSDIGVDDEVESNGSVTFEVWVDGDLAFQSGVLTGTDPAQQLSVDITDASELRLVVGDGGDNIWWDHANWADARLLCGEVEEPPPPQLSVLAVSPEDGSTGVDVETGVLAEFTLPLLPETVNSATVSLTDTTDGTLVEANVSNDGTASLAEIVPVAPLNFETTYEVTVLGGEDGIRSVDGALLDDTFTWSFTTEEDGDDPDPPIEPLTVLSVAPADAAVDVSIDTVATAEFSAPVDPETLTPETMYLLESVSGDPVAVSLEYDDSERAATLVTDSPLSYSTEYSVVIVGGESGVLSAEGSEMAESYSWSFSTEQEETDPPEPSLLSPPTYYPAGTHAHSAHADDVDGDGALDLIVANAGDNTISILFGNGDGSFGAPTDFGVGAEPKNAVTGDFNANGLPDIVSANQASNDVSVLLATGGGSYAPAVHYPTCVGAHEVKTADLNNNGILDLAVACWGGNLMNVLLGIGDGTFGEAVAFEVGSNPHALVVGDFNSNGIQDIAVANNGSANISVMIGNGDGTFQVSTSHAAEAGPHSIDAGDFNGNGILDLVTANDGSDSVSVFFGNGDGTFQSQVTHSVDQMPKSVRVADLTGNGALDIVTANTFGNYGSAEFVDTSISVLRGVGDGTFESAESFEVSMTPFGVVLADLTGNGRIDVAAANWHSGDIGVLLND